MEELLRDTSSLKVVRWLARASHSLKPLPHLEQRGQGEIVVRDPRERENSKGELPKGELPWRQLSTQVAARRGGRKTASSGSAGAAYRPDPPGHQPALCSGSLRGSAWGAEVGDGCGGGWCERRATAEREGVCCFWGRRGEAIDRCAGVLSEGTYLKCKRKAALWFLKT